MKDFDVIVWGATGFTGKLVAAYLAGQPEGMLRWAIAGRNEARLTAVARELGLDVDVLTAESHDRSSLDAMVARTQCVLTTVGPYAKYGSELVASCAEQGVHYCDLTGEVPWMARMIEAHHSTAEASGARIVHTCGFDSIPSDLGALVAQQAMFARHGVYADRVKFRVVDSRGGASGGTVESMMNMMEEGRDDPSIFELLADPYSLNPANMPRGKDGPDYMGVRYDEDFRQWTAPFVMAGINTRVVRRSHALLGYPWGDDFRYDEAMMMGNGPGGLMISSMVSGVTGAVGAAAMFAPTRSLLRRIAPSPGEGPSVETMENGYYDIDVLACHPEDNAKNVLIKVHGDRDPGYGSTSKMIAEAAMCLALDPLETPTGILTPAVAMGDLLVARLADNAGVTFTEQAPQ